MPWRLKKLVKGDYLLGGRRQFALPNVYELGSKGKEDLRQRGLFSVYAGILNPGRDAPHHEREHDLMVCDVVASLELGIQKAGLRFIPVYEILANTDLNPYNNPISIPLGGRRLVPDALFGVEGKQGAVYFALEVDRGTEQLKKRTGKYETGSSYESKLEGYDQLIQQKIYKSRFKLPNLRVLHVTIAEARKENMKELLKKPNNYNLFKALPTFGDRDRAPQPSPQIFTSPWERVGHEPLHINK